MKRLIYAALLLVTAFSLSVWADWESDHPECAITPEIKELARSLDNDPLKIYNWVYNNIDFELYPGCRRGAFSTLLCKRGNDLDQCALLMSLLRVADPSLEPKYIAINAKYERDYISNIFSQGFDDLLDNATTSDYYFRFFFMQNGIVDSEPYTIRVRHHLVKVMIAGVVRYLDPSFKSYQLETSPFDLETTMGFSASQLTNALWNGATASSCGNGIKDANFDALSEVLGQYTSNLTAAIETQCPNISSDVLVSKGQIIPRELGLLPVALPEETDGNIVNGPAELTMLGSNHYAKVKLEIGSYVWQSTKWVFVAQWGRTYLGPEIAAKRLTLKFNGDTAAKASVYLDGTPVIQNGNYGTVYKLTMDLPAEYGSWPNFSGPIQVSKTMSGGANGRYALTHSFGDDSDGVIACHQTKLAKAYSAGETQDSENIWGGSLNLMNLSFNHQSGMQKQLLSRLCRQIYVNTGCIGRAAAENYYFVDMNGFNSFGDQFSHDIFSLGIFYGSAFENAVVEQMQGSDNPGISSARGIYYNNQQGKFTFFATPSTWADISLQLHTSCATSIADVMSKGNPIAEFLIPAYNVCADPADDDAWTGYAFFNYIKDGSGFPSVSATIGSANGGYASYPSLSVGYFNPAPVYSRSFDVYTPKFSFQTETFRPVSFDPIDLYSGSFLSDSTDLNLRGNKANSVQLSRSYSSGQAARESSAGYGWGNDLEVRATESSHGEKITSLKSSPYELAPAIVATLCGKNLINAEHNLNSFMIAALSANWLVDQAVDNVVVVTEGNGSKEFVRRADGMYLSPKNSKDKLTKNPDGSFVLEKTFGETITFGTNGLAVSKLNADGTGLVFSNETATVDGESVDRVKRVTDSYNRYFEFNYDNISGLLTNVVDSTGRSVAYGYDTDKNLTTFTDAENKTWEYHYDDQHQLTYIIDPMERLVVSNSYNALGQVTNQISAIGESWDYAYGGTHTLEIDPLEGTNTYLFDDQGRESGRVNPLGYRTSKEYDGQNHLTKSVNTGGITNLFFYDASHNLTNKVEAAGAAQERSTQFFYDDQHHLTRTVDAMGYTNYFGYDDEHHLIGTTNALGHTTSKTYYPTNHAWAGKLCTATDANTNTVTYTYDDFGNVNTITYPGNRVADMDYNDRGELEVSRDLNGNPTTKTYNNRGLVTSIKDAKGTTITNLYTDTGKLWQTWPIGYTDRKTVYTYTDSDEVESITYANGGVVSNVYDELDRLVAVKDVRGYWTTNQYDAVGRVTNTINALQQEIASTYDAVGNILTVSDALGTVSNQYDVLNRLVRSYHSQDNYSAYTETVYDDLDRVVASFDRNGTLAVTNVYDAVGRIRATTDALGVQLGYHTGYGYDNNGNVTAITNARHAVTRCFYDEMNNCTGVVDHLDHWVAATYDDQGNLKTLTDPLENTTTSFYNELNQLVMTVDPLSRTNWFGYDEFGNPNVVTNARLNVSRQFYDEMNQVRTNRYPIGKETFTYDNAGNLKTQTDALLNTTRQEYDLLGRLQTVIRPDLNAESYGYDPLGNMSAFTNARHIATTFGYDALGLKTNQQSVLGDRQFSYDPAGNLTNAVDELSRNTDYTYDSANRLERIDYEDGSFCAFKYDENSNVRTAETAQVRTEYVYDMVDRLEAVQTQIQGGPSFTVGYGYDDAGAITNMVYPGNGIHVGYRYDDAGEVTNINLSAFGLGAFNFLYDANGNLTNMVYPNGAVASRSYDAGDRLQAYSHSYGGTSFIDRSFIRDALGQKKVEDVTVGTLFKPSVMTEQTRIHNDGDQLTSISTTNSAESLAYNRTGCLTNLQSSVGNQQFSYDCANRLIRVDSGNSWAEYMYDAGGSCVGRVRSPGVTNYFVLNYSDSLKRPLAETDSNGALTRIYIWGPSGLLAHLDVTDNGSQVTVNSIRYYHSDELGSTLALTDASGAVTDEYGYTPYGEQLGHIGTSDTPYRWLGGLGIRMVDASAQLYQMSRRFYSATLCRFLTRDPSGLNGGPNAYLYASANPFAFVDPSGLCPESSFRYSSDFNLAQGPGVFEQAMSGLGGILSGVGAQQSYADLNTAQWNAGLTAKAPGVIDSYAPKTTVSQQIYSFAANVTGAKALTQAITGYGVNNDGSYNFNKTYTPNQRLGLAAVGSLQAATFVWGSAELGATAGSAFSSSSRALGYSSSGLSSPGALTTSRITNPSRMLPASSAVKNTPVVIGEQMTRVNSYARNIGGYTIDDWLAGKRWSPALNDEFVSTMKAQGREFIDIGPAFGRRLQNRIDPAFGRPPSAVYGGERQQLLNYNNYRRVYERTGKYQGGVPGFDF